jgi:DNA helicase HerA-like ATPase
MGRIRQAKDERKEFYIYVDEFQSIATQSFITLLSEGRKFGLGLVLANQFASQIRDPRIIQSIFGNVGTVVSFRLGREDAEIMEIEMFPEVSRFDLLNLPNYHAYIRLLLDGEPSRPFSIRTVLPGAPASENRAQEARDFSRKKYGRPRREVEKEIARILAG